LEINTESLREKNQAVSKDKMRSWLSPRQINFNSGSETGIGLHHGLK